MYLTDFLYGCTTCTLIKTRIVLPFCSFNGKYCSFRQNNKELRIRFSILNSEMTLPPSNISIRRICTPKRADVYVYRGESGWDRSMYLSLKLLCTKRSHSPYSVSYKSLTFLAISSVHKT